MPSQAADVQASEPAGSSTEPHESTTGAPDDESAAAASTTAVTAEAEAAPPTTATGEDAPPTTDTTEDAPPTTGTTEDASRATDTTEDASPATDTTEDAPSETDTTEYTPPATDTTEDGSRATGTTEDASPATDTTEDASPATGTTEDASPATGTTEDASSATDTTVAPAPIATVAVPRPEASTVAGLVALDRPLVIAHAGGDQDYPHSTVYAYTQSALAGADILELDVQLTADGVLIVQHDDTVDRTTEATGPVAELTLEEIQALDNAHWFVPGLWGDQTRPASEYVFRGVRHGAVEPPEGFGPEDFRVATFMEVAEQFPHHVLDVEIKLQRNADGEADPAAGIATAEVLAAEVAQLGREDSVIVACFNDDVLAAFGALAPEVATTPGQNALVGWFLGGEALDRRHTVVQVPFTYEGIDVVTPDTVARVHDEGLEVWVWLSGTDVVETRKFYASLFALGVDGIIAGRPAEAAAALADTAG